ncbi:AraC family transcriptional regulator [Parasegetibacter sp. NRK P23]|uniref:helix-turn-helix domain-containing protein n=1 Tax=Parasegetibacter sp. NRK P23 TaxID=2942999 RepID=UPI0020441564|nr:helix-turn-helix domain-containing protein [Parasegetibacter sp. NRK P23]MCM5529748.1 helix-turn-helix domain-containing protein [Parasegetibacter sp. NRK P23]
MQYLLIIGAFQALIALGMLAAGHKRRPADSLLGWMLACMCAHLSIKFVIYGFSGSMELKAGFNTFIDLAYGPLLWMYAQKVHNDKYVPAKQWFLLLPTLLAAGAYLAITYGIVNEGVKSMSRYIDMYNRSTERLIIASFLIYPLLVLNKSNTLPSFWASERKLIRRMAKLFLVVPNIIWLMNNIADNMGLFSVETRIIVIRVVAYSNIIVICISILKFRLFQEQVVSGECMAEEQVQPTEPITETLLVPEEKELHIARKAAQADLELRRQVADKLLLAMERSKRYTDPDLTLEKLATALQVPRNLVSEVLNQHLEKTFYQFVNEFRVKEVIRLFNRCKQQGVSPNILSLAFEAGFNSKSSFNQYFKKHTGQTPSEYLKLERRATAETGIAAYG